MRINPDTQLHRAIDSFNLCPAIGMGRCNRVVVQNLEEISPYIELTRPYLEFTTVVFGAVSGALHAKRRSFDFVGVVIIGIVSGLGGGVVRDVLIGKGPVLGIVVSDLPGRGYCVVVDRSSIRHDPEAPSTD